jgi:hypothetical protein
MDMRKFYILNGILNRFFSHSDLGGFGRTFVGQFGRTFVGQFGRTFVGVKSVRPECLIVDTLGGICTYPAILK